MSKSVKILILVLTVLSIVLGGYFGFIASLIATGEFETANQANPGETPIGTLVEFGVCLILAALMYLGMLIFYIVNLVKTKSVPKDLKPVWGVLLVFVYWISWIVYWFVYIWPERISTPERTIAITPPTEHESQRSGEA